MSHLYFALGDMLALRGDVRLARSAYKRASELDHPRKAELKTWLPRLQCADRDSARLRGAFGDGSPPEERRPGVRHSTTPYGRPGGYHGIDTAYRNARDLADRLRRPLPR